MQDQSIRHWQNSKIGRWTQSRRSEISSMLHRTDWIAILVSLYLLSGCGMVTSDAPITGLISATPDASLTGQWRGEAFIEGGGPASLDIVAIEPGVYQITFVAGDPRYITNQFGGDGSLIAHTSSLRGTRFLNIRVADDQQSFLSGEPRYVLVRYAVQNGNRLVLWTIPRETARAAVSSGLIAGEERQGFEGSSIRLTGTSPDLRQYLRQAGPVHVFSQYAGRFERVEPASKRVAANIARAVRAVADRATGRQRGDAAALAARQK